MSIDDVMFYKANLERILDNLNEGIIAHDLERRIFFFNQEAEKITGFLRQEVLGKDCHTALGGPFCGDSCQFCGDAQAFLDTEERHLTFTTRSGENRRIDMRVTRLDDEQGQMVGVLACFKDVTDLFDLKLRAQKLAGFANIIGQDARMLQMFQQIRDVAPYDFPVHIFGETGTGKELVSSAIHQESRRSGGPFVPINCGALPEGLIESELFGHVKGAFTGAVRDKKGRFELADGGTLFLDEVAELSRPMQVKLLRVLQEGTFERVGSETIHTVNVRITSATNRDLKKEVQAGRFREDLYYRLNVIPIHLPPLNQRITDIPLLAEHFLVQCGERYGQTPARLSREALSVLMDYSWPGNVRELQNALQFAMVRCTDGLIIPRDLPLELRSLVPVSVECPSGLKLDRGRVRDALQQTGGNKVRAAQQLGVGRATLYRFLKTHDLLEKI